MKDPQNRAQSHLSVTGYCLQFELRRRAGLLTSSSVDLLPFLFSTKSLVAIVIAVKLQPRHCMFLHTSSVCKPPPHYHIQSVSHRSTRFRLQIENPNLSLTVPLHQNPPMLIVLRTVVADVSVGQPLLIKTPPPQTAEIFFSFVDLQVSTVPLAIYVLSIVMPD